MPKIVDKLVANEDGRFGSPPTASGAEVILVSPSFDEGRTKHAILTEYYKSTRLEPWVAVSVMFELPLPPHLEL